MPLFSEQIANMYYGALPSYSGHSYGYNSSPSYGSSYSASYLNPGGSYSGHSSLGGYSRAPLTSRWISSVGRNYSPMLSTITERGSASPVRINSPRRLPITSRTYMASSYTPRPVNINTADIDVSKDKYRHKTEKSDLEKSKQSESPMTDNKNSPFMPRVDGKPETGIDSSPGVQRNTIKRGRPVVRLYTIKRKDRDSPRKPSEDSQSIETTDNQEKTDNCVDEDKNDKKESLKWRDRLSEDLAYKEKKDQKSLGAKLVEKFLVQESNDKNSDNPTSGNAMGQECLNSCQITPTQNVTFPKNVSLDRRCSMEHLAEQANLLDSLIRSENLSTATLDLSKIGVIDRLTSTIEPFDLIKRRRKDDLENPLKTTRSDHSLHDTLKHCKDSRDSSNFSKRRSIKKSASGSSIRRLDSITEFPKEPINIELPAVEENLDSIKQEKLKPKLKPKLKTKITSSVEVSAPMSPLKFRVENVTVEEKLRPPRKEIIYSSEVHETPLQTSAGKNTDDSQEQLRVKKKSRKVTVTQGDLASPEPADGNFWDKIGKRETVYLMKRKQNIEQTKEKHKRELFWFPEEENTANNEELEQVKTKILPGLIDTKSDHVNEKDKQSPVDILTQTKNVEIKDIHDIQALSDVSKKDVSNELPLKIDPKQSIKQMLRDKTNDEVELESIENEQVAQKLELKLKGNKDEPQIITQEYQMEEVKQVIIKKEPIVIQEEHKISHPAICGIQKISMTKKKIRDTKVVKLKEVENKASGNNAEKDNIIGKSSSLEMVSENKVKAVINKKTKSEKIYNANNKDDNNKIPDIKPLSPLQCKVGICDKNKRKSVEDDENKKSPLLINSETKNIPDVKCLPPLSQSQSKVCIGDKIKKISEEENKIKKLQSSTKSKESQKNDKSIDLEQFKIESGEREIKISPPKNKNHTLEPKVEVTVSKATDFHTKNSETPNKKPLQEKVSEDKSSDSSNELIKNETDIDLKTSGIEKDKRSPPKETDDSTKNKDSQNSLKHVTEDTSEDLLQKKNVEHIINKCLDTSLQEQTKLLNISVPDVPSKDIPISQPATKTEIQVESNKQTEEENKAEKDMTKDDGKSDRTGPQTFTPKKPVKEEKALKPLIATPRPLQKRVQQVIHSSDSSDSSEEESSEDESDTSEDSTEFFECENNADGRTSTGSNDSGFDSSAPTSPATFTQIKKGGDNSGAVSSKTSQSNNTDIVEQELEQSTAYDLFRKTGRFTPPARSIPRFRKYTIEDFQFIKVLGKGSFGKVMLAELRDTEYYYAVKCLKKDVVLEDDDVECTLIERKVLALGTNHPYLCHLFATFQTDSHLFFVMEYLNGGDLMFHIQQSGRFPEERSRFYAAEIVSGLKFLHKRGIVYRDLKLDNILLDYEGHVRIADFGMCKLQIYLDKTADTFCGTPDYMAPEIIKGLKYNQTVDWWSFGVLLYEMLIGQSPFSGCDEDELFWSICNEMPSYPRFLSHHSLTILTRLLDKDARTRLGGTECMHGDIREQDFFHPVQWDKLERRELETPFRPRVRHPMDTQYFDRTFTGERPRLTAVEPHVLRSMDQEPFRGFSYTNPNTTDH